jgi:propanol-preferring alcohol dehydrogenase
VVVKVAGSGLCHTDFTVISREHSYWKGEAPPFTLGHEVAGWVEEVGSGVTTFRRGDAVAVNPSWASCGRCHMCRSGEENHCLHQKAIRAPGVGYDGGHAPYILVPEARFLVQIGTLDPVVAGPLTDAGITTYSAIRPALPALWPGSTAVVIGVGGLGLYAIQFLRQLTSTRVVGVDSSDARLKLAREYGADDVVSSGPDAANQIRELTRGVGAQFVLDCVGINPTLATGVAALSWRGRLTMVGAGGGSVPFDFFKVPPGSQLTTSLNGGSIALMEVVEMAALGRLKVLVDRYPLSAAKQAYDDFEHGRLVGRAVLMPALANTRATNNSTDTSRVTPVTAGA